MTRIRMALMAILIACFSAAAQDLKVIGMEETTVILPADQQRSDIIGDPCAVVLVQLPVPGATFTGNVIGEPVFDVSTYRVYMPMHSKELVINCPGHFSKTITFSDLGVEPLKSKRVYELKLEPTNMAVANSTRHLVMHVTPANAFVEIDGVGQAVDESGNVMVPLTQGAHKYRVFAPGYFTKEGQVNMGDKKLSMDISLDKAATSNPALGAISVEYKPIGADVWIDGVKVGTTPDVFDKLNAGQHKVRISMAGYNDAEHSVSIKEGAPYVLAGELAKAGSQPSYNGYIAVPATGSSNTDNNSSYIPAYTNTTTSTYNNYKSEEPVRTGRTAQAKNVVSLNFGFAGDVVGDYEDMYTASFSYEHLFRKVGVGANINLYHAASCYDDKYYIDEDINILYFGPAFVFNHTTAKGWRWHLSFGLGTVYDTFNEMIYWGANFVVGVDYKITKHIGVGLEITDMGYDLFSKNIITADLGVRFYF